MGTDAPTLTIASAASSDTGLYQVEVSNKAGKAASDRAEVVVANTVLTVSSSNDSGAGSLRDALTSALAAAGSTAVKITATGTVTLASPLPVIDGDVAIVGPGASNLTVSGADATATGGQPGGAAGTAQQGSPGQGKGGALFVYDGATASGSGVTYSANSATNAMTSAIDNSDLYGTLATQ